MYEDDAEQHFGASRTGQRLTNRKQLLILNDRHFWPFVGYLVKKGTYHSFINPWDAATSTLDEATVLDLKVDRRTAECGETEIPCSSSNVSQAPKKLVGVRKIRIIFIARVFTHRAKKRDDRHSEDGLNVSV